MREWTDVTPASKPSSAIEDDGRKWEDVIPKKEPEDTSSLSLKQMGKNALGGLAAFGQLGAEAVSIPASGIMGLVGGLQDKVMEGKPFLESAVKRIEDASDYMDVGRIFGMRDNPGYKAATEVYETPVRAGVDAMRGLQALATAPVYGLDQAVSNLQHPENTPISSTLNDVVGPFLGFGAGKGVAKTFDKNIRKIAEGTVKSDFKKPEPLLERPGETPSKKESILVHPDEVFKDVVETDRINPYEYREGLFPGEDLKRQQLEEDQRAADFEARRQEFGDRPVQPEEPLQMSLGLEDHPLREEQRLSENDRIERQREEFPTVDMDLLPERVKKDTVVTGLITRYNNVHSKLRELYARAHAIGMQGVRIRQGELGSTKKSQAEVAALVEEIKKNEALANNIAKSLQKRMEVKHNFVYDEGWQGAPLYSGAKEPVPGAGVETGVYSEVPPSVAGPAERTTGLTVEKTERPNMQRSSDAAVTGAERVQKTSSPLGKGKFRQGGAVNLSLVKDVRDKLHDLISHKNKLLESLSDQLKKLNIIPLNHKENLAFLVDAIEDTTSNDNTRNYFNVKYTARSLFAEAQELKAQGYPDEIVSTVKSLSNAYEDLAKEYKNRELRENLSEEDRGYLNLIGKAREKIKNLELQMKELEDKHQIPDGSYKYSDLSKSQQYWSRKIGKMWWEVEELKRLIEREDPEGGITNFNSFGSQLDPTWNYEDHPRHVLKSLDDGGKLQITPIKPTKSTKLNKGPGGKQSGGVDPSVFTEGLAKLLGKGTKPSAPKYAPQGKTGILASIGPAEPRTVDKFVEDVLPKNKEDYPGYFGDTSLVGENFIPPDYKANITAKKGGNPFVSFINAKLNDIDRRVRTMKENAKHGEGFAPNIRGWVKRVASEDGALTLFRRAAKESKERIRKVSMDWMNRSDELAARGLDYPTTEMYAASGLNPTEIKAIQAATTQLKKLLDHVNAVRKQHNQEPIKFKPGFFPGVWDGDFRIMVKDAEGTTVRVVSAWNKYQAKKLVEDLKKQFPELKVNDPITVKQNKYAINDTSAFQLIHEMVGDTPMGKLVAKYAEDVKAHRGFNRHALHKKGVSGSLGSGVGDVKGWEKAISTYLDAGYEYIGDMERTLLQRDLKKKLEERGFNLNQELPKTARYIDDITANAKKAIRDELSLLDSAVSSVFQAAGLGPNAHYKVSSFLNGAASTVWLTSVKFLELNAVQPLLGLAKMREVSAKLDGGAIVPAIAKALGQAFIPGLASADTKALMTYAKKHGMVDAKFLEVVGDHLLDPSFPQKVVDTLPKHLLGVWEQEVVRTPMIIAFNEVLKDVIKNPEERYAAAGAFAESTMVNYSRTQQPKGWARMGFLGDNMKPMKQFALASIGQLSDYTNTAIKERSPTPLLVFLGVSWALAGIKGMAPMPIANSAINSLNSMLSEDHQVPSVEEMLMKSGMSDMFIFGPTSKYSGQNLTGSLAFPDPGQLASFPGFSYAGGALAEGANLGMKALEGNATEMDKMRAALAAAPAQAREAIKERFTRPGEGVPNPKTGQSDVNPRTEGESLLARITAAEPYREGVEKASMRGFKAETRRQEAQKKVIKEKIINDFVMNGELNEDKIQEFIDEGGDPKNISSSILKWMKDDFVDFYTRQLLKAKGMSKEAVQDRVDRFRKDLNSASEEELVQMWKENK